MGNATRSLRIPMLLACAALACAGGGGCNDSMVKLYPGPSRPRDQVARVYNTDRALLLTVDDRKVWSNDRWSPPPEHVYEMLPGRRALRVARLERMRRWSGDARGTALFEHELLPGHEYSFVVEEVRGAARTPVRWRVTMVEYPGCAFVADPVIPPRDDSSDRREQ